MIAYIHFVSGTHSKKKFKVPIGDIKRFDPSNIKPRKLYEVKCGESYERAFIIHVAETEESLNALIEGKRSVIPPQSQLLSPSDSSFDESSQSKAYHVKPRNKMPSVKNKENLQELLNQKMENLKSSQMSSENEHTRKLPPINGTSSHAKSVLKDKDKVPGEKGVLVVNLDKFKKPPCYRPTNSGGLKVKTSDLKEKVVGARDAQLNKDRQLTQSKPKVLTIAKVHDEIECSRNVKSLVKENKSLQAKVTDLEEKINDQNIMIKDITQLNMELQKCVISHFDELKATVTQMASAEAGQLGNASNFPPVGYVRKVDKMMHLGRGEWLPKNIYDSAVINAKSSSSTFTRNLSTSVFGQDVLLQSTLTGCGSNRKKERNRQYPKLDENKLLAIHETFRFWALTDRQPPLSEAKALLELSRVNVHISQKIADLKRAVRKYRPAGQKTENEGRSDRIKYQLNRDDTGSERLTDSDGERVRGARKVMEKKSNDKMRSLKTQNIRDKPQQTINKDRSARIKHQGNREEDTGSDRVTDSDGERVRGARKVMEKKSNDKMRSLKTQNIRDKPQQSINEDRSARIKHQGNREEDTGSDRVTDSDGERVRGARKVMEKKSNNEVRSPKTQKMRNKPQQSINEDISARIKHQGNREEDTGSDRVTDSDGERVRGARKVMEKKSNDKMRSLKTQNIRDKPQQSINEDRSARIKHQGNREEDTGSDRVTDSDGERVRGARKVMEKKSNNEVRSPKTQKMRNKPQQSINEDISARIKHQGNREEDTGSDRVTDSDGERVRGARKVMEKKSNDKMRSLKTQNIRDKPQQSINEDRSARIKHQGNREEDTGSDRVTDSDGERVRGARKVMEKKSNNEVRSPKTQKMRNKPQQSINEDRSARTKHQGNREEDTGSDRVTDSDGERVRGARKVMEKKSNDKMRSLKTQNIRDKPQQTINKDRSARIKHQGNREEDTGSDRVTDSDGERVRGARKVMEKKSNNEMRSPKTQKMRNKPQQSINEDRSARIKHQGNREEDTGSDRVMDSDTEEQEGEVMKSQKNRNREGKPQQSLKEDGSNRTNSEDQQENDSGLDRVMENGVKTKTTDDQERVDEKAQDSRKNTAEIESELHQGESDSGSTTDMFEEDIYDAEYADILADNEYLQHNKDNKVDVLEHNSNKNKKKPQPYTEPVEKSSDAEDDSDHAYTVEVLSKKEI